MADIFSPHDSFSCKFDFLAFVFIGWIFSSYHPPAGETLCGHAGVYPKSVEFHSGTLKGNTVTFESYLPSTPRSGSFVEYTATICNPSLLDSTDLPMGAIDVVFTGHYFSVEDSLGNEVVYLKLHDIVRAPKGFND